MPPEVEDEVILIPAMGVVKAVNKPLSKLVVETRVPEAAEVTLNQRTVVEPWAELSRVASIGVVTDADEVDETKLTTTDVVLAPIKSVMKVIVPAEERVTEGISLPRSKLLERQG